MSKKEPLKVIAGTPDRPLVIGDIELQCYVLEDETRALSQRGVFKSINATRGGPSNQTDFGAQIPRFASQNWLKPFISSKLIMALKSPILFRIQTGQTAFGYPATMLVDLCDAIMEARKCSATTERQRTIVERAETLVRGLATVGIIGLVDEATGYQEIRDGQALHKILDKFLTNEARKWAKTFPDEFWHKLIKVKGHPNYIALKRPSFVGHWVNDVVYSRLAPGIVGKLKEINPRTVKGDRKHKHHQHLTIDHGIPELREHLIRVMVLMDAASNPREFDRLLNTSLLKYSEKMNLLL